MTNISRLHGVNASLSIKAPCVVSTTANITLSGAQTIDGVAVIANDRVLVKNQTIASENGIYDVQGTAWIRSADFDGARDVVTGSLVYVYSGNSNPNFYEVTSLGIISVGTTDIDFSITAAGTDDVIVNSITELRAISGNDIAIVRGYYANGDGGGGTFYWDSSSTSTDNNGTIIKAASVTTGRWVRLYSGWVDVKWFGATGDGSTDDVTAVSDAFDYIITSLDTLFFSAGTYRMSTKITKSSANTITIQGEGKRNTTLYWDDAATSEGFDLTYTDNIRPTHVYNVSFITAKLATGTALKITGPETASVNFLGPRVENVEFAGADTANDCWDISLHFYTCWYIKISDITIKGKDTILAPFDQTAGIKMTSCQVIFASDFSIYHVDTGILEAASGVTSHGEGFSFEQFEIVGVNVGISLAADSAAPGTNIGPGHINAYTAGILATNQYQTSIHDLLLYKTQLSTANFIAISLNTCLDCIIHDNTIRGDNATGDTTGIQLVSTDDSSIHDNSYDNFFGTNKFGIVVGAGCDNNDIHDNKSKDSGITHFSISGSAGTDNVFSNNYPLTQQSFASTDATPSVGNALNDVFLTANASSTSITDFDDGYLFQKITILINDANTTLVNSSTIHLQGGTNYSPTSGSIIHFFNDGAGLWREAGRRVA